MLTLASSFTEAPGAVTPEVTLSTSRVPLTTAAAEVGEGLAVGSDTMALLVGAGVATFRARGVELLPAGVDAG